jgi:long-chain acyl-CoA synthetase
MKFNTLVEAVAYWAERTPDKVCLIDAGSGTQMTYGELWRSARIFARRLREAGVQKGDRVVVRVGPLLETLTAQFGVYCAGGVYCPVEKHMKNRKIFEMLDYFDSMLIISSECLDCSGQWIDLASVRDDGEPLKGIAFPNPEDMCAIVFTTGTTGKAKGVIFKYLMASLLASAHQETYGINDTDIYMWVHPLDRAGGIRAFASAFCLGITSVHYSDFIFVKNFFTIVGLYGVTVINLHSTLVKILLENADGEFAKYTDQIKIMMTGGNILSEKNKTHLTALLPHTKLFFHYNMTEITPISYAEFTGLKQNCVGRQFSCTYIHLVDNNGDEIEHTSKDNFGIIECKNAGIMLGYWKDPDLTKKTLRNGWIVTADIGYMDQNGLLYLLGRRDDVIVSGGYKISPYEIEEITMQIPGVLECACVSVKNNILDMVPKLFIVMRPGEEFSANKIRSYLSDKLESFKLPRMIKQLDSLPKTDAYKKIDRKALQQYD